MEVPDKHAPRAGPRLARPPPFGFGSHAAAAAPSLDAEGSAHGPTLVSTMGISKDIVKKALAGVPGVASGSTLVSGDHVLWISACDTYASVRLQWREGAGAAELEKVAAAARVLMP